MEDSILKEIREARTEILKECKYNLRSFTRLANAEAEQFQKDQFKNSHKFMTKKLKSGKPAVEHLTAAIAENNGPAFIAAIKNILEARGVCQADLTHARLAEKLGITAAALSKLSKNGVKQMTIGTLDKIADALDMELIIKLKPRKAA